MNSATATAARPVVGRPYARSAPCDLCGASEFRVVALRDRLEQPLVTVICTHCGLIAHGEIPSLDELTAYYAHDYRSLYNGETTPSAHRVVRDWMRGRALFDRLRKFLPAQGAVLDIGAGVGCNIKHFELAGHGTTGIEPGEGFCAYAREELRAAVDNRRLEDLPRRPQYDLVLLVHVIEHLRSPREALEHIRDLLVPGGRLYVECPNVGAPHAAPRKLFHFAHLYNFCAGSLESLAGRCGFSVETAFGRGADRNLYYVLRKTPGVSWKIDSSACDRTLAAIRRWNTLTYHLRPHYLRERMFRLTEYATARLTARAELARILEQCRAASAAPRPTRPARAA